MKKSSLFISLCLIAGFSLGANAQVEGVLDGMPDPSIIRDDDGRFYIFATGEGLPIYRSDDLVEWEEIDRVFDEPVPPWAREAIPGTEGIWAPEIGRINDRFYVYYSVSTFGSQRSVIGVAVSDALDPDSPDYGWEDLGLVIESFPREDPFNAIDAAPFQDEDGRAYMVWGSYNIGIMLTELDPETGKILEGAEYEHVASHPGGYWSAIEAPYMTRRGDYYYLWVSWDWCCGGAESTYKVMVGRSENPTGPFLDHRGRDMIEGGGTLVVANNDNWRGTGHNSVVKTDDGDWIAHHTYDTRRLHLHRIQQVRPLYWCDEGWPVAGEPVSETNPMALGPVEVSAEDLHGSWRISVDYEEREIIDLLPGGRIAFDRDSSWRLNDGILTLMRPESDATCFVEHNGVSFIGRNGAGEVVRGIKINPLD